MGLSIQEEVEICRKGYDEIVKPYIEKRQYKLASSELKKLFLELDNRRIELSNRIRLGFGYLTSAQLLEEKLMIGKPEDIFKFVKIFEAYQSQTKLPLTN